MVIVSKANTSLFPLKVFRLPTFAKNERLTIEPGKNRILCAIITVASQRTATLYVSKMGHNVGKRKLFKNEIHQSF